MASQGKRLARRGKYGSAVRRIVGIPYPLKKAPAVTRFRMTQARSTIFGIVEVQGIIRFWLKRKPVHFRVGLNCDRIAVEGATLFVFDGKTPIASAAYEPLAEVRHEIGRFQSNS